MVKRLPIEKAGFVLSLGVLAFLYGYLTRWHEWFPNDLLEQASRQASQTRIASHLSPNFVNPAVYDRSGARVVAPDSMQPGVTLVTSLWQVDGTWRMGVRLLDRDGTPVHRWNLNTSNLFPGAPHQRRHRYLHGTYLYPDGDLVLNVEYQGTVRLDACGAVEWTLSEPTHHSIHRADDGSFWIAGHSTQPQRTSPAHPNGYPGLDEPVWVDEILRVSERGDVLQRINVLDVLYANDLARYVVKAHQPQGERDGPTSRDVTHLNDVEPLSAEMADAYPLFEAGDLAVSLRNAHLVFVFDPDTNEVKWHASDPFILQHDPDFMGDGWIGVFDNNRDFTRRGTMLGGSRIVAMQPHTDSTRVLFPTPHADSFYTHAGGKWQHLANGNLLLTEARPGRVVEVTRTGRTVWEWIRSSHNGSDVATVLEGTRYPLTPEQVASWSCGPNSPGTTQTEVRKKASGRTLSTGPRPRTRF
jgi:hypothetical protein